MTACTLFASRRNAIVRPARLRRKLRCMRCIDRGVSMNHSEETMMSRVPSMKLALTALLCAVGVAHAQDYPSRPLHFVVPYAAGGGGDIVARIVGQKLGEVMGQQVVIDNRAGAN